MSDPQSTAHKAKTLHSYDEQGGDMLDGFFTSQERGEFFDVAIFSGNEKFAKPDKEFLHLLAHDLKLPLKKLL